jgi:hypothetical protein
MLLFSSMRIYHNFEYWNVINRRFLSAASINGHLSTAANSVQQPIKCLFTLINKHVLTPAISHLYFFTKK